jgi:hypothetical protein
LLLQQAARRVAAAFAGVGHVRQRWAARFGSRHFLRRPFAAWRLRLVPTVAVAGSGEWRRLLIPLHASAIVTN